MPTEDFSETGLKLSYWYLTHRAELRKWWVLLLAAADVFLLVFVATNTVISFATERKRDALLTDVVAASATYRSVVDASAPSGLTVVTTTAVPTTAGSFDLVARVKNPNRVWAVRSVTPTFTFRGKELAGDPDFLLPGEEKYLLAFGLSAPTGASVGERAEVSLSDVTWVRLPDVSTLPTAAFEVSDVRHAVVSGGTGTVLSVSEVTGTIENASVSNFRQVRVKVVAMSGSAIVGVNRVFLDRFEGLTTRPFVVQWSAALPAVSTATVVPEVNVLEADSTYTE